MDRYYLWDRDDKAEETGVYKGIVSSLGDKYATYYTEEELKLDKESNAGEFSGIGCTIGNDTEYDMCYIAGIMEGYGVTRYQAYGTSAMRETRAIDTVLDSTRNQFRKARFWPLSWGFGILCTGI